MIFQKEPTFSDIDKLNTRNSGFYPVNPNTALDGAVREALWEVEHYPTLQVLWRTLPLWSAISFVLTHPRAGNIDAFDAHQMAAYLDYRAHRG